MRAGTVAVMRRFLLVPLTAVALVAAGCGDDSSDTASTPSDPPAAESTPSTSTPAGKEGAVEIGMKGLQFAPKDVTVKVGTTVTWKNLEDVPHNVSPRRARTSSPTRSARMGPMSSRPRSPAA